MINEIIINVKILSGKIFSINVCKNDSGKDLKKKIFDKIGVPIEHQILLFAGC